MVLGSAVVLVPWYVLCASLAGDVRTRAEERDRVMVVAEHDEVALLVAELERAPERAAAVVGALADLPARRRRACRRSVRCSISPRAARRRSSCSVAPRRATTTSSTQAALLHEEGVRVRTLSLFYEQWLGKLPIGELERVSLLFDIGELHAAATPASNACSTSGSRSCGLVALAVVTPIVVIGNLVANRGPLFSASPARVATARVRDAEVPHHARRRRRRR